MMRFKQSRRGGGFIAHPAHRAAALLIAALAGGCSAEITRFDFPGFSLTDDKKDTTSSLQEAPANRGPNYLGNEGREGRTASYDNGYSAPPSNGEGRVAMSNLPDAPDSTRGDQRAYDQRGYEPRPYDPPANAAAPPSYREPPRKGEAVEVQPGDTLYGLSRRHHVSVAELMEVNGLSNPSLKLGQKIYLPDGYPARQSPPHQVAAAPQASVSVAPDLQAKYAGSYTMKQGDSIYGISRSYGVPVAELQQANGITDARAVRVGTVLKVPGSAAAEPPPPAAPQVAEVMPVSTSAQSPTVINRRGTEVATTGAIVPPAAPRTNASASDEKLRWPVQGRIITGFGQRNDGTHNDGINLSVPQGTAVHAAEGGVVAYAGSELKGYGNLVLLRHDNGWVTAYAHNDLLMVKRGDKVQRGQIIAKAGRTGSVDQPQVHFELRQGSKPVDPVPFLERL